MIDSLWQDVRFGFWLLYKNLKFSAVVVICLALGIGPNTTIFSLINAVVLRSLDVKQPDRLVLVRSKVLSGENERFSNLNYPEAVALNREIPSLRGLTVISNAEVSAQLDGETRLAIAEIVASNFFDVLGRPAILGEPFHPQPDELPGSMNVVVLGHEFWMKQMRGDPSVVGSILPINGTPFQVLGVMGETFTGSMSGFQPDFWVPMMAIDTIRPDTSNRLTNRFESWLVGVGRLAPGASLKTVQTEMDGVAERLADDFPESNASRGFSVIPLESLGVLGGETVDRFILGVMAVVGLVLLVACSSVAAMLLARSTERRAEIAIRLALGATRRRLVRQLLVESLLLSFIAGLLALLMAMWSGDLLIHLMPNLSITLVFGKLVDGRVLLFTMVLVLLSAFLFGLVPALRASRPELMPALKDQPSLAGGDTRTTLLRNAFVVVQFAISVFLLILAGLFLKGLRKAASTDPGFSIDQLLVYRVNLGLQGYNGAEGAEFAENLRRRLAKVPGVRSVSMSRHAAMGTHDSTRFTAAPVRADMQVGDPLGLYYTYIAPGYFETLGIPLIKGRDFTPEDRDYLPPVAIVNEALAERFWPGQDPTGKMLHVLFGTDALQVIGVARQSKIRSMGEEPRPFLYLPMGHNLFYQVVFHLRTERPPQSLLEDVRSEILRADPKLVTTGLRTMEDELRLIMWPSKMLAGLSGALGILALLLAMTGVYGVVSYSINLRRPEVGIRLALGAQPRRLLLMLMAGGLRLIGLGCVLGLLAAFFATPLAGGFYNGISPRDPAIFLVVAVVLFVVAFLALAGPAWRTVRLEPMSALRYE